MIAFSKSLLLSLFSCTIDISSNAPLPVTLIFSALIDDPGNYLPPKEAKKERRRLFGLLEKLILWENTDNRTIVNNAIKEIKKSVKNEMPIVLDPFCGGGSIPLESCRLGLKTYGSDLNPVAVLITKTMVEYPQRFNGKTAINPQAFEGRQEGFEGIASDVTFYGELILKRAKEKLEKIGGSILIKKK